MPIDSHGVSPQRVRVRRTAVVTPIENMAGRGQKWHKVPRITGVKRLWRPCMCVIRHADRTANTPDARAGHSQHV